MENKNNVALYSLIFTLVGLFIGWLIWGNSFMGRMPRAGVHEMSGSHMMTDENMDMNKMMNGMMGELNGKTGDAFDKAFIKEMIVHHEGAVAMAEAAKINAKHQEIKTMADAIISAQTSEIEQMKKWLNDWYNEVN
jgi:uncharacterized protein (DUF305 family)